MNLSNISIILVEPQGPLNIGGVCRAMMNFGFSDLRLVNPQADHHCEEARRMAVSSTGLLENATVFPGLVEALDDCQFVLGTTRRFGKYREDFLHPDEASRHFLPWTEKGRVGLVFGREDHGLSTAELDLCHRFITIPTAETLPSMNLAQAVSVCLYETAKAVGTARHKTSGRKKLAPGRNLAAMYQHMRRSLLDIGFLDEQNPDHILRTFRRIFGRAALNDREVRVLHGLWNRIDWVREERKGKGKEKKDDG